MGHFIKDYGETHKRPAIVNRNRQGPNSIAIGTCTDSNMRAEIHEGEIFLDSKTHNYLIVKRDPVTNNLRLFPMTEVRSEIDNNSRPRLEGLNFKVQIERGLIPINTWSEGDFVEIGYELYQPRETLMFKFTAIYMGRSRIDGGLLFNVMTSDDSQRNHISHGLQNRSLYFEGVEYNVNVSLMDFYEDYHKHKDEDDNLLDKFM